MGNQNRKATKSEMAHARQAVAQAYPDLDAVWGAHGDYGGHRAPRDHTISFRLRDRRGKFHSNVVWLMPAWLGRLTVEDIRGLVEQSNGGRRWKGC